MEFREFIERVQLFETHKLTTDQDVSRSGTKAMSQDAYIKAVQKLIAGGTIQFNTEKPEEGSLVLYRPVLTFGVGDHQRSVPVGEEGSNLYIRRIRTYLHDPTVLPNMPRASADTYRGVLHIFFNPETNRGVTIDGKSYDQRFLISAIAHELIHLSDPGIAKDRDEFFTTNQDYFADPENMGKFLDDTAMEPRKDSPSSWSAERFATYYNKPKERKAQYGGDGYEMAHRMVADSDGDRDKAMEKLRRMGMDDYIGTTPLIQRNQYARNHYGNEPEHMKKTKRAAFDYLDKMMPPKSTKPSIGRGADYYANLKATDPKAYYALLKKSQTQPTPKPSFFGRLFGN